MLRIHRWAPALALAVFAVSPLATQSVNAARPIILAASVTGSTLTVWGSDLGPESARVTLGTVTDLVGEPNVFQTQLTVRLPGTWAPGSYALQVNFSDPKGSAEARYSDVLITRCGQPDCESGI